jgi:FPC/CPF motif-containing protein YcgG
MKTRKKEREVMTFKSPEEASAYKTQRMNEMLKKIKNLDILNTYQVPNSN